MKHRTGHLFKRGATYYLRYVVNREPVRLPKGYERQYDMAGDHDVEGGRQTEEATEQKPEKQDPPVKMEERKP